MLSIKIKVQDLDANGHPKIRIEITVKGSETASDLDQHRRSFFLIYLKLRAKG